MHREFVRMCVCVCVREREEDRQHSERLRTNCNITIITRPLVSPAVHPFVRPSVRPSGVTSSRFSDIKELATALATFTLRFAVRQPVLFLVRILPRSPRNDENSCPVIDPLSIGHNPADVCLFFFLSLFFCFFLVGAMSKAEDGWGGCGCLKFDR